MAGFWGNLLSSFGSGGSAFYTPRVTYLGASEFAAMADPSSMTVTQMWESQPHFRTVVTFIARNIAQLGLHSFERLDSTDRQRDRDSVLARTLRGVDGQTTTHELIFALVGDLALYDRAYWWAAPSSEMPSGWMIRRLPPTWVEPVMANAWEVKEYKVYLREGAGPEIIPADKILAFPGYHPGKMVGSSPTVDALRQTLQEQVEAAVYRSQVWKRGGRVSAVLERPKDAPAWTDAQADRFREDWYANFTGKGKRAGGTPLLEDGMTLRRIDFNAQEQQFVEAAKLSLTTVASAFHVNPTMIGQNDGANYSNVREFRKMLYGDTLGPLVAQIESRINTFLVPRMGLDATHYVEFNIEEKLQGNFEEQGAILQTATGGPWMTRNEARAMRNLPALEGGDDLIVPLNVIEGGQASPSDSGTQNQNAAPMKLVKAPRKGSEYELKAPDEIPEDHQRATTELFAEFFARQRKAILSSLGAKDPEWWDAERWDEELTEDLVSSSLNISKAAAVAVLTDMGIDPKEYSTERTQAFLRKVAERIASGVNGATVASIESALADGGTEAVAHVFNVAESSRAEQSGMTAAATFVGFGMVEAARQTRPQAQKRWQVNSGNPRSAHSALNGETVGIDDEFSSGQSWPGSFTGDPEDVANCQCSVVIIS